MPIINKPHRSLAVLSLPKNVSALVTYATGIVKDATGNPNFPSPTPPLATLQKGIDDLQGAETEAQARTRGAAAIRNAKKQTLVTLLEEFRTYVQSTADTNPENGPGIIQSAGLALRKQPVRPSRGFHAKAGKVAGTLTIAAPAAARRASYEWQYSVDGGVTWVAMPSTLKAKTSLAGLKSLTTVQLRYRALTAAGEGDWSAPIPAVVP